MSEEEIKALVKRMWVDTPESAIKQGDPCNPRALPHGQVPVAPDGVDAALKAGFGPVVCVGTHTYANHAHAWQIGSDGTRWVLDRLLGDIVQDGEVS